MVSLATGLAPVAGTADESTETYAEVLVGGLEGACCPLWRPRADETRLTGVLDRP